MKNLFHLLFQLAFMPLLFAKAGYGASSDESPLTPAAALKASVQKQRESLAKQRQSLQEQLGQKQSGQKDAPLEPISFITPFPPLPETDCAPLPSSEIDSLIASAAKKQSLQPELLHAVMKQESGFKACAVSVKGAQGLMQLMPATADRFHVADPFDPSQNVEAGAAFLKQMLNKYKGDLRLALVAYNAGPKRADDANTDSYPEETQNYIASIFADLGIDKVKSSAGPLDLNDDSDESLVSDDTSTNGDASQQPSNQQSPQ